MSSVLFSIVGTTSTGKSESVFHLADTLLRQGLSTGVDIISADSRQIYMGLELLSGADLPEGFEKVTNDNTFQYPYYQNGQVRIHGLSCIKVSDEWSVSQFQELALSVIEQSLLYKRSVFVVGGTGLYHEHLLTLDPILHIPPNPAVRTAAQALPVEQLQAWLGRISPERLSAMNNSDKHNPRRLQRAIEVALAFPSLDQDSETQKKAETLKEFTHVYFGLTLPEALLEEKIRQRVTDRFAKGAVSEVKAVCELNLPQQTQALSTLGFAQVAAYLEGTVTQEECITSWAQADIAYSHRQMTWWKRNTQVQWFDKSAADCLKQLESALVQYFKRA